MSKLKPCPFCGGEAEIVNTSVFWVKCKECGAESSEDGTSVSRSGAVDSWNKRLYDEIIIAEKDKVIRELLDLLECFYPYSDYDENGDEILLGGDFLYCEGSEYLGQEVLNVLSKYKYKKIEGK